MLKEESALLSIMYVYGFPCALKDVTAEELQSGIVEWMVTHHLLVFPCYTRATCINSHGYLNTRFWTNVERVLIAGSRDVFPVSLEHPYLTKDEAAIVQRFAGKQKPEWFYVPVARLPQVPTLIVQEVVTQVSDSPSVDDSMPVAQQGPGLTDETPMHSSSLRPEIAADPAASG